MHNRSGVGSHIVVTDMNGDGMPDIVTSTNLGTFVFQNLRKKRASLLIIASAACAWPVTISAETALSVLKRKCGLIW